jgi:hypothetical protein
MSTTRRPFTALLALGIVGCCGAPPAPTPTDTGWAEGGYRVKQPGEDTMKEVGRMLVIGQGSGQTRRMLLHDSFVAYGATTYERDPDETSITPDDWFEKYEKAYSAPADLSACTFFGPTPGSTAAPEGVACREVDADDTVPEAGTTTDSLLPDPQTPALALVLVYSQTSTNERTSPDRSAHPRLLIEQWATPPQQPRALAMNAVNLRPVAGAVATFLVDRGELGYGLSPPLLTVFRARSPGQNEELAWK